VTVGVEEVSGDEEDSVTAEAAVVDSGTGVDEVDSVVEVAVVASGHPRVGSGVVAEVHPEEEEEAGVASEEAPRSQWSPTDMKECLSAVARRMLW